MSNGNFTNGSLVMRVWQFDGCSELLAKFQYFGDAQDFAKTMAAKAYGSDNENKYFYLAVCDYECKTQAFFPGQQKPN
jgi:hypothetical protein